MKTKVVVVIFMIVTVMAIYIHSEYFSHSILEYHAPDYEHSLISLL